MKSIPFNSHFSIPKEQEKKVAREHDTAFNAYNGGRLLYAVIESDLSSSQKLMLLALTAQMPWHEQFLKEYEIEISVSKLAGLTGLTVEGTRPILKSLCELGYISKQQNGDDHGCLSNKYKVLRKLFAEYQRRLEPAFSGDNPDDFNPAWFVFDGVEAYFLGAAGVAQ